MLTHQCATNYPFLSVYRYPGKVTFKTEEHHPDHFLAPPATGPVTHAAMVHGAGDESLTPHSPFPPHSPLDPLQPFRDYYLLPQRDAKALIAVRSVAVEAGGFPYTVHC